MHQLRIDYPGGQFAIDLPSISKRNTGEARARTGRDYPEVHRKKLSPFRQAPLPKPG